MKIKTLIFGLVIMAACAVSAFAGDVASFVNLGFSEDSAYFMFGVHGIDGGTKNPFSELYFVDVKANNFAPGGVQQESFPEEIQPGQDSSGALYTLVGKNSALTQRLRIKHLKQGRPLYVLMSGDAAKSARLEFRDFITQNQYSVQLVQKAAGTGAQARAAFHINLDITSAGGGTRAYTIGRPDYYRDAVLEYRICQVLLSPDEKHIVFVIERDQNTPAGKAIRYMVETVKIF